MGEKAKMLAGALYTADDPELAEDNRRAMQWLERYNASLVRDAEARHAMLHELFGEAGAGCVVRPPFYCDYGFNIRLGANAFLNFGCIVLDVVAVTIGARTQIGPAVQLLTADHPREAALRRQGLEFGRPIAIGADVWIGGGAIVLPGVIVGDGAIIGAGAVVTRDVAPGDTVAGNPARPLAARPEAPRR